MNAVFIVLIVIILIASVLLTAVVLLQNGKGEGLATNFTSANQALGVRQAADLLEKATWVLVSVVLVLSIVSAFTLKTNVEGTTNDDLNTAIINQGSDDAAFPALPQVDPSAPAAQLPGADVPAEE